MPEHRVSLCERFDDEVEEMPGRSDTYEQAQLRNANEKLAVAKRAIRAAMLDLVAAEEGQRPTLDECKQARRELGQAYEVLVPMSKRAK